MNTAVVVLSTFYAGMPPEQVEGTSRITWNVSSRWPQELTIPVRGSAEAMSASCRTLLFLILVAQCRSFNDPTLFLLALPPGISGVLSTSVWSDITLNVMSLMGVVMLTGVAMSNSLLIVELAHHLRSEWKDAA